jgi:hypothetical protein
VSTQTPFKLSPAQRTLALLAIFFALVGAAYQQPILAGLPDNANFNFAASTFLFGMALALVLLAIWLGKKKPSHLRVVK